MMNSTCTILSKTDLCDDLERRIREVRDKRYECSKDVFYTVWVYMRRLEQNYGREAVISILTNNGYSKDAAKWMINVVYVNSTTINGASFWCWTDRMYRMLQTMLLYSLSSKKQASGDKLAVPQQKNY